MSSCACSPVNPCSSHGPCLPWCDKDDIIEIPQGVCDTSSCLDLIEQLNSANPGSGDILFAHFARMATSLLYRLSGEQFTGTCRSVVHFVDNSLQCCAWPLTTKGLWPWYGYDAKANAWLNGTCRPNPEQWWEGDALELPHRPICSVDAIVIPAVWDGLTPPVLYVLDPDTGQPVLDVNLMPIPLTKENGDPYLPGDTYPMVIPTSEARIINDRYLVRCDGQDWDIPDPSLCQSPPGLSIVYRHGYAPPLEGVEAACELACELMMGKVTGKCKLGKRINSVTTKGASYTFIDPMEFLKDGHVGLYLPDLFLATWNPYGHSDPPEAYFPTVPTHGTRRTFNVRSL
jgi:hypothetical protein